MPSRFIGSNASFPYSSNQFPPSGKTGETIQEKDQYGNTYQWSWNDVSNLWLSADSHFVGLAGVTASGYGYDFSGNADIAFYLPGCNNKSKIWITKTSLLLQPNGVMLLGSYYASTTNELRGIGGYKTSLANFSTQGLTLGQFTAIDTPINAVFNSRLMDWRFTIVKAGLDVLTLKLNFSLEYKLIR